jgi:hypothetical protein
VRFVAVATGSCCDYDELPFSISSFNKYVTRYVDRQFDSQTTHHATHMQRNCTRNFRLVQGWTQLERLQVCSSNTSKWHTSLQTAPVWFC